MSKDLPLSEKRLIPWDIRFNKFHDFRVEAEEKYREWLRKEVAERKKHYGLDP